MTTTDAVALRDATDREILAALTETWGMRLVATARFGREAGRTGVVSGWRLTVADGDAVSDHILYLDEPGDETEVEGTALVTGPGGVRRIWRYPEDPGLPALRTLVLPEAARVVLHRLGIEAELTGLALASYRPGRRAVVRVSTAAGNLFVKVVPPAAVDLLVARHRAWRSALLPSPPVLASAREGLVVLGALPGRSAVDTLGDVDPTRFADALRAMRTRVSGIPLSPPARVSPADRLDWYVTRLTALDPGLGARAAEIAAPPVPAGLPTGTVHGDLHLAQLLVDEDDPHRLVGVLDVDTSGTGDPGDDDAALWAHLAVLAGHGHPGAHELAAVTHAAWGEGDGRARIAAGTAALLIGHALSGHLPVEHALALAAALRAAPDENPLTPGSSSPHAPTGT